jgi:hypothetical protein
MPKEKSTKNYHFVRPGNYRIEVEGYLDESWSDRLAAMRIVTRKRADQTTVAT